MLIVTTQLHEVEVRELKPKYWVKVTMDKFYYLSRTSDYVLHEGISLKDL